MARIASHNIIRKEGGSGVELRGTGEESGVGNDTHRRPWCRDTGWGGGGAVRTVLSSSVNWVKYSPTGAEN